MAKSERPPHLQQPLAPLKIGLLASPEEITRLNNERLAEKVRRLDQLREHFGIPPGPAGFALLALRLAEEHEPAFQERKPRGRPTAWNHFESEMLAGDMRREIDNGAANLTEAARRLSQRDPWISFLKSRKRKKGGGNPGADATETLLTQYRQMAPWLRNLGEDTYIALAKMPALLAERDTLLRQLGEAEQGSGVANDGGRSWEDYLSLVLESAAKTK